MVTRLVLRCTYTGAPRLVTWGARERGWDHSGFLRSSGSPAASPPAASRPPNPPARGGGGLLPLLPLFRPRGSGSRGPGRSYSRTWAAGGGASAPPAGGSSAARPEWGPTAGGPGAAPDASSSGADSWRLQKGRVTRGRRARDPAPGAWLPRPLPLPQPTGPSPSDFSGSSGWSFPGARTRPCRGGPRRPGGGAFLGGAL